MASKLPKMVSTCFMTKVAKNGSKWLHVIAKNGNKRNDLQLYRELNSLFCHFWQYFGFSSVIMLSKNCQKRQFLLTSKLPKMANKHTWTFHTSTIPLALFPGCQEAHCQEPGNEASLRMRLECHMFR